MIKSHYQSPELQKLLKEKYMSQNDMTQLIYRYQNCKTASKKEEMREDIFNNNIRFIKKISLRHANSSKADPEDLFNSGVVGFFQGLDKFKLSKKVHFTTFIKFWIDKCIYDHLYSQNILYIPKHHFHLKKDQAKAFTNNSLVYLDSPISLDGEGTRDWSDVIADTGSSNAENDYVNDKNISVIFKIINNHLTEREKIIVRSKYLKGKTYVQIAKEIGISHSSANNIGERAIYRLRKIMQDKLIGDEFVLQDNIKEKTSSTVGHMMTSKQRDRISISKRNPSQQTRKKLSAAKTKLSVDMAMQVKKSLLSGKSQAETAKEFNISDSAVYKMYKNKLIYARDGGVVFTPEDVVKIKHYEGINRFKNGVAMAKKNKLMRKEECKKLKMETGKSTATKVITDSGPSETKTIETSLAPDYFISTIEKMRRSFLN